MYLKESYGDAVIFPVDGRFDFNSYDDQYSFDVVGAMENFAFSTPQRHVQSSTPMPSQSSQARRPLCTVKATRTRADLGTNGRPSNSHRHNQHAFINLYSEEEACVTFELSKIKLEMQDESLMLVGSNGLAYADQEKTKGIHSQRALNTKYLENIFFESDKKNLPNGMLRLRESNRLISDELFLQRKSPRSGI